MNTLAEYSLLLGVCGVLGTTVLFPLLAGVLFWCTRKRSSSEYGNGQKPERPPRFLSILVPCSGETELLINTLVSIRESIEFAKSKNPHLNLKVIVGLDGNHPESLKIAEELADNHFSFSKQTGKWSVLKRLIYRVPTSDWVALVDCGIIWKKSFLHEVSRLTSSPGVIGLSPSYVNIKAGFAEKLVWRLEAAVKNIENYSGGPVSIHGASIFYKREPLCKIFEKVSEKAWLNDDVIIPLMLRAANPDSRFIYLKHLPVYDSGVDQEKGKSGLISELRRRKRILEGNIQWILGKYPEAASLNSIVGLVALRRVFRVFWAYWGILLLSGIIALSFMILPLSSATLFTPLFLIGFSFKFRNLFAPFIISLAAPVYLLIREFHGEVSWK